VKSRTSRNFWRLFRGLPADVQQRARAAFTQWSADHSHPGLSFKCVDDEEAIYSARIGLHWRVLGLRRTVMNEDTIIWYWIGSHAEYDRRISM
jgi:hypothetical protein